MTEQEMRVACAELLGWQDVIAHEDTVIGLPPGFTEDQCPEGADGEVPNYPRDLNAAREAMQHAKRNVFNADQWEAFGRLLYEAHPTAVVANMDGTHDYHAIATFVADLTAGQICECLLRAGGKWKD